jgi:hypothetical protein
MGNGNLSETFQELNDKLQKLPVVDICHSHGPFPTNLSQQSTTTTHP